MADDGIKVVISPSAGAGGKRLAESPSSQSSAADKSTGNAQRFAQPGTGQRSEINIERKLVETQTALVAEIKQLRQTMRATAPGTSERATLQSRINDLLAQQKRNLTGAGEAGAIAKERALTSPRGAALLPSGRIPARALFGAASGIGRSALAAAGAAWAGDPLAAGRHLISAGASAYAAGGALAGGGEAAGEAVAAGGAAAGSEAAAGGLLASLLTPVGLAGTAAVAGYGAYQAYQHRDIVKGIAESPFALYDARHYSRDEAVRQTQAYGYAREFGEAGGPLSAYTRGSRFSALGMDAQQALDVTGGMREIAGSQNVSEAQAYRAAKVGTAIGLNSQDIAQIGGAAGKLGIDPERLIDIVAKGVERGGQKGLQGEVGRATLDYLRTQSQLGTADERKAAETVTGMAALLGASGIAAFKGSGAVAAGVAGISAANQPGDLFGVQSIGQSYTMLGQAKLLQSINTDPRFKRMSALDRVGMTDRILTQNFTGPNAKMYLKSVIAPEIEQAKSQGLYGLESLEKQYGFPVGDQSDRLVTGSLLKAAESGDVSAYLKLKSQLEANGPKNIPAATVAMAGHAMARAGAGASALGTFAGVENVEAAMLRRVAIAPSTDKDVASLLNKFAGVISPTAAPKSEMSLTAGDDARIAGADLSRLSLSPMLRAEMGAPATATAPGGDEARDSTLQGVGIAIVNALNLVIAAITRAPVGEPAAPGTTFATAPAPPASLPSPARPDKKTFSHK